MAKAKIETTTETAVEIVQSFLTMTILDKEQYEKAMETFVNTASMAQEQAVSLSQHALLHFHRTGNVDYMNTLYKKTVSSMRRGAIKKWFQGHAPVVWDGKAETFVKDRKDGALPTYPHESKRDLPENAETIEQVNKLIQSAFDKPFYDYKDVEDELADIDFKDMLLKRIKSTLDAIDNAVKKSETKVLPADLQDDVQALRNMRRNLEAA